MNGNRYIGPIIVGDYNLYFCLFSVIHSSYLESLDGIWLNGIYSEGGRTETFKKTSLT